MRPKPASGPSKPAGSKLLQLVRADLAQHRAVHGPGGTTCSCPNGPTRSDPHAVDDHRVDVVLDAVDRLLNTRIVLLRPDGAVSGAPGPWQLRDTTIWKASLLAQRYADGQPCYRVEYRRR